MSVATSVSYVDISNNEPDSVQARINTKVITIPASVVEIADNSFENSIVESIIFIGYSQLKTIGKYAFKNCKFLKSIIIPASVVQISDEAFCDSSLEKIIFTHDSKLQTIGQGIFRDCNFLKSIKIPDSLTTIGSNSFLSSAIEEILFGNNSQCTIIGQSAFEDCHFLKSIQIPPSVLKIEYAAFANSNIQTSIFTDDSRLKVIGEFAFNDCNSLQSIKIPSSVVTIDCSAFSDSTIKEVIFSDDSKLEVLSDYIFERCRFLRSITIPASILTIGEFAFAESGIEEILFSDNSNLKTIGKHAFHKIKANKPIQIPLSVVEINECAFKLSTLVQVIFAEKSKLQIIHLEAFSNCKFLKSLKIPDSVVTIAEKAFFGCELEEVVFSMNSKLETIGKEAFLECKSLQSFTFPQSLREIGCLAFSFCNLPKSIAVLSTSVDFLGDPFTNSGVDEIIFGNFEKIQTTEKNNHFLQLCKEGDLSKCVDYIKHNDINLSYTKSRHAELVYLTDDAISIAMSTKNADLITFLIKNMVLMYSNCQVHDIKKCFSDDDIIESVFFESAIAFWYSICSFVMKKVDGKLIPRLLKMLESKDYFEEWVNIFKDLHLNTSPQLLTQGNSLDFYHFLIEYDFIKVTDLKLNTIQKYFDLASQLGNVAILKKSLEILPKENISFQCRAFLSYTPQDKLYSMIEYTLPYLKKNENPFGLINRGHYEDGEYLQYPETVLSYLAYAQAFDAFKYIIENVPSTQYTPSHLVACSLFRGYKDVDQKGNIDRSNFMKLFEYILQDHIRPHVLGKDKEWIGKSIFTCIEYGSSEMCMKLFSYGFDKDDIYIDVISDEAFNSLIRYSLLSYACKYQSLEVVQFLIDIEINVDGLLPNHTNSSHISNKNDQTCNSTANEDEDEDGIESKSENKYMVDDDIAYTTITTTNANSDVTNPKKFIFENILSIKNAWFEPYFNPYRVNKNHDVDIYYIESWPYDPLADDPLKHFQENRPTGYLTLLNVTPLAIAIHVENLDLVRLLLKNGANPNANTFSGFPHLFVLGMGRVINLDRNYRRKMPYVEYPLIDISNNMEEKKRMENDEQMKRENGEKMEDRSGFEDVHVQDNPPDMKFTIFQELVNHGADLFHDQRVYYVDGSISSLRFTIYDLCTHLNYSLDLLKYLQKIPQLGDKIKKHYINSFRSNIVGFHQRRPLFSVYTIDYMFQNGYLSFETYKKDDKFGEAIKSVVKYSQKRMKSVLEKYGFNFTDPTNETV